MSSVRTIFLYYFYLKNLTPCERKTLFISYTDHTFEFIFYTLSLICPTYCSGNENISSSGSVMLYMLSKILTPSRRKTLFVDYILFAIAIIFYILSLILNFASVLVSAVSAVFLRGFCGVSVEVSAVVSAGVSAEVSAGFLWGFLRAEVSAELRPLLGTLAFL